MSNTLLRLGLWTAILVLVLYVVAESYPDQPFSELIPTTMLQQALLVAGALIAGGVAAILTTSTSLAFSDGQTAGLWACFAGTMILLVYLGIAAYREERFSL